MYFFTEHLKIQDQNLNQAFGAIDINQYRLGNMFSAVSGETPKAFAITDGQVLVQKIDGTNKYSIVLKPTIQPDLNFPKIDYIIYKGIKEDSLISGSLVAPTTENDLTRIIHENATAWYAAKNPSETVPATEPDANRSLGLVYNATSVEPDYLKLDSAPLSDAFFATNGITLTTVFGGNYIGNFDTSGDFGIIIVFEKIGFQPTFKLARELDSLLTLAPLGNSPTNADVFQRKHKKEEILAFIDSCAFFGAFSVSEIKVYNGTSFESKTADSLYTEVISKHFNKNKIYIDIRNDFEDSFNYYENYNNTIKWSLDNSNTLIDVNYYRNFGWPILVINDEQISTEFSSTNINKIIKLSFPSLDQTMLVYFKKVFRNELEFNEVNDKLFINPVLTNGYFSIEDLKVPKSIDRSISNYFQIKILTNAISSNAVPTLAVSGFQIPRKTYLDNLFPVFDMTIPFDATSGKSLLKVYYDSNFVDKKYINNSNYTSNIGIAKDNNFVTLISFPNKYNLNIKQNKDDKMPLSGMEGVSGSLFLLELDNKVNSIKLVKSKFTIDSVDIEFLKFVPETTTVLEPDSEESVGLTTDKFTFDDVTVLALTTAEYDVLLQLKNTEFTDDYKVYLGIHNIVTDVDDNGITYTKFEYCLRSLKNDGSGNITVHEAFPTTPIISYTDSKLNGIEYERNYEEAIGYDNFQSGTLRYEDYFISLQSPIETIVNEFEQKLNNVDLKSVNLFKEIKSLVKTKSKALWQAAYNYVQSHPTQPDDRPLYWARLKMAVIIKQHPYFLGDLDVNSQIIAGSQLNEIITLFEENSRNYKGVDFSAAPAGAKKILITGFDPFFLNPSGGNILQSNPSGCACLSLHAQNTFNNIGYVQGMIVPVRFRDFDSSKTDEGGPGEGIIEKYIQPYLSQVDMVVTISQSLPGHYDIDKYATVTRGDVPDNLNHSRTLLSRSIEIDDLSLEWIYTSLPNTFINPPVQYNLSFKDSNGDFHDGSTPPVVGERMNYGPGGSYLSNEIFYRVAKLRQNINPALPTGHFHISKIQNNNEDFNGTAAQDLVNIVKNAFNNAVTGL
jgi:hypothetical protein